MCEWGSVLAWEPHSAPRGTPSDVGADWRSDPTLKTEIEVRFNADGSDRTRVELEHRHLDRYGARREAMRRIYDTEGDWVSSSKCSLASLLTRRREEHVGHQTGAKSADESNSWKETARRRPPRGPHSTTVASPNQRVTCRQGCEHAYRVTDEDFAAVRESGLSEDQVFEIVVCAAIGEAPRQYDRRSRPLRPQPGRSEHATSNPR